MFPKISCIIPVYNAEKYLHRCLDTVCNQTYSNLEIILVDDGSSDNSGSLCDTYAAKYHNIKVYHISNSGASSARKIGLDMSTSEYVTFVDSDDYVEQNYVSAMYEALQKYGTTIAGCGTQCIKYGDKVRMIDDPQIKILKDDELMTRFFNYEFWALWGGLYPKTVFTGIHFPKATLSEDYFIKCQMFLRDSQMAYVDAPLYIYEKHEGSLSNTKLSARAFEEFENTLNVYELIKEQIPQYSQLALKNAVETTIKLLLMGNAELRNSYKAQYVSIRRFLNEHLSEIYHNRYLLGNVKTIAVMLIFCPCMDKVLDKILQK
ncbi:MULTISPECIES: glycosyltransferase family 2 protein [Bacteroides]|jgi:glycosyltransferase involved in cell wall biosynthesis|uniref:glycosyltransferase family 2 protein n=1 Tax=Bacteroides TaxID=816 RepID=UPI00117ED67A|nr:MULTISPECIES: glycosyltransferase family 2 protein [Bacteroides]